MSMSELQSWSKYLQIEPHNSIEIQIAYLTYMAGAFLGNKNKKLDDYLITAFKPKKDFENKPLSDDSVKSFFANF